MLCALLLGFFFEFVLYGAFRPDKQRCEHVAFNIYDNLASIHSVFMHLGTFFSCSFSFFLPAPIWPFSQRVCLCATVCVFANHVSLISLACCHVFYSVALMPHFHLLLFCLSIENQCQIPYRSENVRMIQVVCCFFTHSALSLCKCKLNWRLFKYMHCTVTGSISRPFFFLVLASVSYLFFVSLMCFFGDFGHFANSRDDASERMCIVSILFR